MKPTKDPVWSFFASVRLALVLLLLLSLFSIIGTVLPQGEPFGFYVEKFGGSWARCIDLLDLDTMYRAWWFLLLLALFSVNLIICSIDRLPDVWKAIRRDPLNTTPQQLEKRCAQKVSTSLSVDEAVAFATRMLAGKRFAPRQKKLEQGILVAGQRGAWTRLGVYIVHLSILVIFLGAIIGTVFGYKAFVMLPETASTNTVTASNMAQNQIPLGFTLRCDRFSLTHYPNGMPKEFRSDLTIVDKGQTVLKRAIVVNDPLTYKGITFYQASYQPSGSYRLSFTENGQTKTIITPPGQEVKLRNAGLSVGILGDEEPDRSGHFRLKIWLAVPDTAPAIFWLDGEESKVIERGGRRITVATELVYATGLQVAKDPGIWFVYLGCVLMLFGLCVAFFLSHQRIWILVKADSKGSVLTIAGTANKHKRQFDNQLEATAHDIQGQTSSDKEARS